jgi:hypothetical protein
MSNRYYKGNPINNKAIAKDCEDIFCKTYMDKIRFACAINADGNKIYHIVRIANKQSAIILN